jgi:L-rhamnose mutarotase
MERVCFLLQVHPERLAEYKERHRAVWPEMLQALRETGWHNYSLFLRSDGLLVGYFETPSLRAALDGMARRDVNERWQREMAPFFSNLDANTPDQSFLRLEEIFHLDAS